MNSELPDKFPLILKSNLSQSNDLYHLPQDNGYILFSDNEVVNLVCPNSAVVVKNKKTKQELARAKCKSNKMWEINNQEVKVSSISCTKYPFHTAQYTGRTCNKEGTEIEIGFKLQKLFLRNILICFDTKNQIAQYSLFNLTSSIGSYQQGVPRPRFIVDNFYKTGSKSLHELYNRKQQRETINTLLGLPKESTKYIKNNEYFLSKGHLSAKADFVFGAVQRSTFHYVNVVPQWQIINGGNWKTLEWNIRQLADKRRLNLKIYTGTHGVSTLPHEETNEDIQLYLYVTKDSKSIPVPQFLWKLVYDPNKKEGAVFVVENNPYYKSPNLICTSICNKIKWINVNNTKHEQGVVYCCNVNDRMLVNWNMPELNVTNVLE